MSNPVAIGVDIGSTTWKAVVIDENGNILAKKVEASDPLIDQQTTRAISELRTEANASDDVPVGATGYGRKQVKATKILTEITCHAKGAFFHTKTPCILIDIGGQDTKVIHIGQSGEVTDFSMNDKCAAGTGRFLEVILGRLKVNFEDIESRINSVENSILISSTCTVFAESEVVSLLAQGKDVNQIVKGLHDSLSTRVTALAGRIPAEMPIYMSGGVAHNPAMVKALNKASGKTINVLPEPQLTGALGAALAVSK